MAVENLFPILYPEHFNRTAPNEDLYKVKQSLSNRHLLYLEYIGCSHPDPMYEIFNNNPTSFSVEYVLSGKGYLILDNKRITVSAGDTFVYLPFEYRHYWADPQEPWEKIFITFSGRMAQKTAKMYNIPRSLCIKGFDTSTKLNTLISLARSAVQDNSDPTEKIIPILHELLYGIYTNIHRNVSTLTEEIMKDYLDNHINKTFSMDDFAASMNLSKSQITRLFKKAYGTTPYKYLLNQRIDEAKTALIETTEPLKNIAGITCFYDEYYFSTYFKQITGYSPSEYRRLFSSKTVQNV